MGDFIYRVTPWWPTLVAHNWPIMICSSLILWAAVRAYVRLDRSSLLLLYSFLLTALAFEYQKHGTAVMRGTFDYLFEVWPTQRFLAQLILVDILPYLSYLVALFFAILSLRWWRKA